MSPAPELRLGLATSPPWVHLVDDWSGRQITALCGAPVTLSIQSCLLEGPECCPRCLAQREMAAAESARRAGRLF